jgi:iron complex outermembrane recepter protein
VGNYHQVMKSMLLCTAGASVLVSASALAQAAPAGPTSTAQTPAGNPAAQGANSASAQADATDQDSGDETRADIVVTGTRGSLNRSLDLKREQIAVVDSISAEDIGKFPDQNVAESLQRIPGVSIDRSAGEGRSVTVRGFGPQFNTVLLNNRLLATENSGREFSFDVLPSDLISAAEVYKSSTADQQDGGIGSTVILRTARPLDRPGLRGSVSLGAKWDSTRDKATPDLSAFISDSNEDKTFGILASIDYYKRESRFSDSNTSGWFSQPTLNGDGTPALPNAQLSGVTPGRDVNIFLPRTLNYTSTESSRERIGGTVAIDWVVSDKLKIGIDALYTQFKVRSRTNQVGWFTDPGSILNANVDENGTVTDFTWNGNSKTDNIVSTGPVNAKTYQIGLNAKYTPGDRTSFEFDVSHSNARNNANSIFDVIGETNTGSTPTFALNKGGVPTMTGLLPTDDPNRTFLHCCSERGGGVGDDIWQVRLDGKQDFDAGIFADVRFGLLGTRRKKSILSVGTPEPVANYYGGYYAAADPSIFTRFSPGSILGLPAISWLDYDHEALVRAYGSEAAITSNSDPAKQAAFRAVYAALGGTTDPTYNARGSGSVRELTGAAYLQAEFKGDIGTHNWQSVAGIRYVYTDEYATGNSSQLIGINFDPRNPTGASANFTPTIPVSAKNKYGELLPSWTLRFNWDDKLDLRAAVSRTMTRPTLSQLTLAEDYNFRPPNQSTLSGGNAFLKPYFAWNYDLGVNYYLGKTSYLSVAGFYKSISNFVSNVTTVQTFFGLPFNVTRPTNANSSKVYGFEATAQFTFENVLPAPLDGLGVSANYTKVESSTSFDPSLSSQVFNVEGLSDSANAVAFYEKGPIQMRIAYNWRAPFLRSTFGDNGQPSNIDSYDQWDLSGSVQVIHNASIFVQVLNLTNNKQRSFSSFKDRFSGLYETGRILTAGVRTTF